jgi:hypothetical protein
MQENSVTVELTREELALLCDALDSHEYWQLGHTLPRNDGLVFIPGDFIGEADRYWHERRPSLSEREAIDQVREARLLAQHLDRTRVQRTR